MNIRCDVSEERVNKSIYIILGIIILGLEIYQGYNLLQGTIDLDKKYSSFMKYSLNSSNNDSNLGTKYYTYNIVDEHFLCEIDKN